MAQTESDTRRFNWGRVSPYVPDLRSKEFVSRVKWFIQLRWLAVAACAAGAGAAVASLLPATLSPLFFAAVALFLAVTNAVYTGVGRNLFGVSARRWELKILLLVQMISDFTALSVLTYGCGTVETPIVILFMAHIILATLFFNQLTSLAIVAAAWLFAALPLVLEWAGVVPTLSIFDSGLKETISKSTALTGGFVLAIGAVFFVLWYLTSAISASLKLRELQLEEAHRIMVRMDREKTQATLRATHELKAPFAAIKSYVYTLRDGYCGALPEKAMGVVTRIGERCDTLSDKITDIIHLSNLKTLVVSEVNLQPVDMSQLVEEEIREGALIGERRGIRVEGQSSDDPIYIEGSKAHLRTLLSNLIQNAVCYARDQEGEVTVSLNEHHRKVLLTVSDNGIGIPDENLCKIFDEYFRSKNAVAHHPGGTGLGLPLVREIARLHGATIQVNSTVGKGTTFTVSFDPLESKQKRGKHGEHTHS